MTNAEVEAKDNFLFQAKHALAVAVAIGACADKTNVVVNNSVSMTLSE